MLHESAKLDELLRLDLVKFVTEVKPYQIYDLITTLLNAALVRFDKSQPLIGAYIL